MKKRLQLPGTGKLLTIVAISIFAIASCKKKKNDSVQDKLIGKWKIMESAIDSNNNGKMDAFEVSSLVGFFMVYVTFHADKTAAFTYDSSGTTVTAATYSWELLNNGTDLKMKIISGTNTGFEQTGHIESLTKSDMVIRMTDTTSGSALTEWDVFNKQ